MDLWPDHLIVLKKIRFILLRMTVIMKNRSMQLKLCCRLPVHNIETFQQPFGLYWFLLVAVKPIYLPVFYIALVDHMWMKHVCVKHILEWRGGYVRICEGIVWHIKALKVRQYVEYSPTSN